jgi:hypothetical protein
MENLAWDALEYEHTPRSSDWFWGLGILAVGSIILSFMFGNVLFGIVLAVGALSLGMHAVRHPKMVHCEIGNRGISLHTTLFPYQTLQSFCIQEHVLPNRLVLTSQKLFMPHITVPLSDVPAEAVRAVLSRNLREEEVHDTFIDHLLEGLGF